VKLTFKLVTAFMLPIILLTAAYAYFTIQRETRRFHEETQAEAQNLGEALRDSAAAAWRERGHEGLVEFIHSADGQHRRIRIRWVWFDAGRRAVDCPAAAPELLTAVVIEQHLPVEGRAPDGTAYLHTYWPISLEPGRHGGLEFSRDMSELQQETHDTICATLWLMGAMVLASGLVATIVGVRMVGRPLEKLVDKTRRVGAGDLSTPVHVRSHDELAELGESLNRMCDRLAAAQTAVRQETAARIDAMEQLRHADRLKTVGRVASGMAHELGTPINVVSGRAELIASGKLSAEKTAQSAAAIKQETDRMAALIRELLNFARRSAPERAPVDLRDVLEETVDLLTVVGEKHGARLHASVPDQPAVARIDPNQMKQVMTNLVVNAIQAMPDGGTVALGIRRCRARPPQSPEQPEVDCYAVSVQDEGVGIPPKSLPHLFEPFFTTKAVGEGTGLGLSVAYGIVEEHEGWIGVESEPGGGSCFTVYLPAEAKP